MEPKDLLSDEAFCRRLEAAKDADEAIKLFAEKGITVTKEQLDEARAAAQQEELDEEALDGVSGGCYAFAVAAALVIMGLIKIFDIKSKRNRK